MLSESKGKKSYKEKVKLQLEQFISPANRYPKPVFFTNNRMTPQSITEHPAIKPQSLFSPQYNQFKVSFSPFVEKPSNYKKISRQNFLSLVEQNKHE